MASLARSRGPIEMKSDNPLYETRADDWTDFPEFPTTDSSTAEWTRLTSPFDSGSHVDGATEVSTTQDRPLKFGNYLLLEQLGSGGGGVVFRARAQSSDELLAVKVIRPDLLSDPHAIQRFEKEARLHAQVASAHIPRQLEFGKLGSLYFIASELVSGEDLRTALRTRDCLAEFEALRIAADVLKALKSMHAIGMVHRDVKPGNVIVDFRAGSKAGDESSVRATLTDFGLARHIDQSQSLDITQRRLIGTPLYQAPEQFEVGSQLTAALDIYSLGVTLYSMLVGEPPFSDRDFLALAESHRTSVPHRVCQLRSHISGATSSIVARALEKNPHMRYPDAASMLADIENVLAGRTITIPGLSQKAVRGNAREFVFHWHLNGTPHQLWPLLADTDRFNRAIDLPAPEFEFVEDAGERKRMASANFMGLKVRYREHPFEWVEGREFSVLREFENGPFKSVISRVELAPLSASRTRLTHSFEVETRGWLGKLVGFLQFKWVTPKSLDRVYRRIEMLARQTDDPFACDTSFSKRDGSRMSRAQLRRLDENLREANGRLASKRLDDSQIERIYQFIVSASDRVVTRIQPKVLARKLSARSDQVLHFCLTATELGLLSLFWDVICPVCRVSSNVFDSLADIQRHQRCEACDREFETDFADGVELVFRVHPEYRDADTRTYCIGGPFHAPHVMAQLTLLDGQEFQHGFSSQRDNHVAIRGPELAGVHEIVASEDLEETRVELELSQPTAFHEIGNSSDACVGLRNQNSGRPLRVRLERTVEHSAITTAAEVATKEIFQRWLAPQFLDSSQLSAVTSGVVVGVRWFEVERLASHKGENEARQLMRQWEKKLSRVALESQDQGEIQIFLFDRIATAAQAAGEFVKCQKGFGEIPFAIAMGAGEFHIGFQDGSRSVWGAAVRSISSRLLQLEQGQRWVSEEVEARAGDLLRRYFSPSND